MSHSSSKLQLSHVDIDLVLQFYDNLVKTGSAFLTLNQANQANITYHSKSHLLGFELKAYKPYVYTGFSMGYLAVGECCAIYNSNRAEEKAIDNIRNLSCDTDISQKLAILSIYFASLFFQL